MPIKYSCKYYFWKIRNQSSTSKNRWCFLRIRNAHNGGFCVSYLPVFVMIISVPSSLNLSHSSFVSKKQSTYFNSSQLHFAFIIRTFSFSFFFGGFEEVELDVSLPEYVSSLLLDEAVASPPGERGSDRPLLECFVSIALLLSSSPSLHCSTSTSSSRSNLSSPVLGESDVGGDLRDACCCCRLEWLLSLFGGGDDELDLNLDCWKGVKPWFETTDCPGIDRCIWLDGCTDCDAAAAAAAAATADALDEGGDTSRERRPMDRNAEKWWAWLN